MIDLNELLRQGPLPARELADKAGSRATLSRDLRRLAPAVVRIGRARATRYGLRRRVARLDASELPVFAIDEEGRATDGGRLVFLQGDVTLWQPADETHDGLPPIMADMAPQGFLGRRFEEQHPSLGLPPRLSDWSHEHVLIALACRSEDAPGNLIFGEESFDRWQDLRYESVTRRRYPALAADAIAGEPFGSSAGGEQPKFTAFTHVCHAIVKFAPRTTEIGQRWSDLLVLEHLALDVLRKRGIAAAETRLYDTRDLRFLEVVRFDRIGERGRRPVMSLNSAYQKPELSWAEVAEQMYREHMLGEADARALRLLEAFALSIANTDRHHYNILLFPEGPNLFALAPAFDQVPMGYAPTAAGQLRPFDFAKPRMSSRTLEVFDEALHMAVELWERGSRDERITDAMRRTCAQNATLLR